MEITIKGTSGKMEVPENRPELTNREEKFMIASESTAKVDSKFKEKETLPKVQIKSPDGVHGEVWIDGQKLRGVRRVDFSLDAERVPAQEMILHLMANVDIETCAVPKFQPFNQISSDSFWEKFAKAKINPAAAFKEG